MTTTSRQPAAAPWPDVATLIPHRAPMLLVERIVDVLDDGMVCAGSIPADGPLARGGTASSFLGVELAAQTAAVLEALRRAPGGGESRIGYLASIRDARFAVPELPAGRPLLATVRRLGGVPPLAMYAAVVTLAEDGAELVTATLSTYLVGEGAPAGDA